MNPPDPPTAKEIDLDALNAQVTKQVRQGRRG